MEKSKTKLKIMIFVGVTFIVVLLYILYVLLYGRFHIEITDSYSAGNQNSITSQVSGTIKEIMIEDTQIVKQGELIAIVDDVDYKLSLAQAEANLGQSVKSYYSLMAQVNQNKDSLKSEESNLKNSEETYRRDLKSFQVGLISKQSLENSKNSLEAARASYEDMKTSLKNSEIQLSSQNIYTHPLVAGAITNYKNAYINLLRTRIYSPVDGKIVGKSVYLGQQISVGQNLASVIDLEDIWVNVNAKETEMDKIKIGNLVQLESDYNSKIYEGYIQGISAGSGSALSLIPAQNATGNWIKIVQRVPIRVAIKKNSLEKNGTIPIGTSVVATVKTKEFEKDMEPYPVKVSTLYSVDEASINEKIKSIIEANSL
ncbi:HlyD family secretion protein [Cetobacterium sp. 2A]|uniref:HlyD family secretion protein n=1 Tax=unclassified Cetobacterium TaxID=2630983 RepID=UPI00163CD0C7|nr:HlyD family secretion protein [Cetobacterium sp. 2A]MBC2855162.1 HlyD family secretion protein [Cetobacterium sp. 2A]